MTPTRVSGAGWNRSVVRLVAVRSGWNCLRRNSWCDISAELRCDQRATWLGWHRVTTIRCRFVNGDGKRLIFGYMECMFMGVVGRGWTHGVTMKTPILLVAIAALAL